MKTLNYIGILILPGTLSTLVCAGQPAAVLNSQTNHGGNVTSGSATVLIGGVPAARVADTVFCPVPLHVGGPIITGSATVLINGKPAARVGDSVKENLGTSTIVTGNPTVLTGD